MKMTEPKQRDLYTEGTEMCPVAPGIIVGKGQPSCWLTRQQRQRCANRLGDRPRARRSGQGRP